MIDERLKKVLSAIIMCRYQTSDCFDICISILKQEENLTKIQINEDRFNIEKTENGYTFSDGMKFTFDEKDEKTITVADEDCYELLEFYKIRQGTYLILDVALDTIYSISTMEISEFGNTVKFKSTRCNGDDYSVDPVSNFWLYSLAGKRQTPVNIYCVKSSNHGIWVLRKEWKTELAISKYYPDELKHTLSTGKGEYELYRFRGLKLASMVYKNNKNKTIEKDVIITESTVTDFGEKTGYKRIQKGAKVFYI